MSRLGESLAGSWPLNGDVAGSLHGDAKFVDSPFGKAVSFTTGADSVRIPRTDALNVGAGDFTVAAWIHPTQLRKAAIVALGDEGKPGWYLDLADNRGTVRFETTGPDNQSNGDLVLHARGNSPQRLAACGGRD